MRVCYQASVCDLSGAGLLMQGQTAANCGQLLQKPLFPKNRGIGDALNNSKFETDTQNQNRYGETVV
jgi:hypothetical protein